MVRKIIKGSYFGKYLKNMMPVIPRKTLIVGFNFSKFGCCKPTTFPKRAAPRLFFLKFAEFFQNRHKEQLLVNIAQKILSKKGTKEVMTVIGSQIIALSNALLFILARYYRVIHVVA